MNAMWSALANGTIAGAALAAAVWLALRLMPRGALNAATRYGIWWITLAAILTLPLLFFRGPVAPQGGAVIAVTAVRELQLPNGSATATQASLHLSQPDQWKPIAFAAGSWMARLLALWIAVSAALLLRLLLSCAAMYRKSARAAAAPPQLQERLAQWLRISGASKRHVRLAGSSEISIPVATGPAHPSILIPARLFSELSDEELDQVGLHEAAHLARRDDYALLCQRVIEATLALHPVVRFLTRQIDLEREIACDDLVVESTGRPRTYAACLTRMVALCGGVRAELTAPTMADNRSHVSRRVELLVARSERFGTRLLPVRLIGFALALVAVTAVLTKSPSVIAFASAPSKILQTASNVTALPVVPLAAPVKVTSPAIPRVRKSVPVAAIMTAENVPEPGAEQQEQSTALAQSGSAIKMLVLYFDLTNLNTDERISAFAAAQKFVSTQLKPDDRVAIIVFTGSKITVTQDFTGDASVLDRTLQQLSGGQYGVPYHPDSDVQFAALQSVVRMLGPLNGKKALAYFNGGWPRDTQENDSELRSLVNSAIRSNVAFYPIDTRGIVR